MSNLNKVSGQSIPVDVLMVKQLGLLLVSRAETILDQLKVPHLTEEQICSIRFGTSCIPAASTYDGVTPAPRKRRSENGEAKTARLHGKNGAAKTVQ